MMKRFKKGTSQLKVYETKGTQWCRNEMCGCARTEELQVCVRLNGVTDIRLSNAIKGFQNKNKSLKLRAINK